MRVHSDSFETVLPKTERFFIPKTKAKPKVQFPWAVTLFAGILMGGCIIGAMIPRSSSPAGGTIPAPAPVVAATPPAPLPEVRQPTVIHPVYITQEPAAPRARLIHLRPIGTYENDLMPDGRVLSTLYKGELPSAASLPTSGGQLGDMWYTRADGHTWVLAPVTGGSQAIGWVDP